MDERLQKFIRLIEAGTYTKAAQELHVSQPALTVSIQKLEKELGAQLLVRSGKKLELTRAGRVTYQAAQEHQQIEHNLTETLQRISRKRPAVTIGMIDSLAERLCSTKAFEELESSADITLIVNNSRYLRESIERHKITCALIIDDELEHRGLTSMPFGKESLQLVCHPEIHASLEEDISQGVINNFISYDRPSTTYRHIQHYFSLLKIRTKTRLYSTSPDVMLNMVFNKRGCAVLPEHMSRPLVQNGELVTLLDSIGRPVSLIKASTTTLPGYLEEFWEKSRATLDC